MEAAVRSLRMRQKRAAGSRASSVAAIDSTGVMPLPPTIAAYRPGAGSRVNRPAGVITSSSSPTLISFSAYVEKAPPSTSRTPTRSVRGPSPSGAGAGEQIEYVRRISAPSVTRRRARCCPGACRYSSLSSSGTVRVRATESSVRRSTAATWSGWKRAITTP